MRITPLQLLLLQKIEPIQRVRQATGRSRATVWRWARGKTFPVRRDALTLVDLYGGQLDLNGCYQASVDMPAEEAARLGLPERNV